MIGTEELHALLGSQIGQRRPRVRETLAMTAHATGRTLKGSFALHQLIVRVEVIAAEARGAVLLGCGAEQRAPKGFVAVCGEQLIFGFEGLIGQGVHFGHIGGHLNLAVRSCRERIVHVGRRNTLQCAVV